MNGFRFFIDMLISVHCTLADDPPVKCLSFSCSFWHKSWQIIGFCQKLRVWRPVSRKSLIYHCSDKKNFQHLSYDDRAAILEIYTHSTPISKDQRGPISRNFIQPHCFNCFLTASMVWLHTRNYRHWWSQSFEFPVKKWRSLTNPTRHISKA